MTFPQRKIRVSIGLVMLIALSSANAAPTPFPASSPTPAPTPSVNLPEIFKEIGESKDGTRKAELLKSIAQFSPKTRADIQFLSQQMEGEQAPLAHEIIRKTKDPALVPDLIQALQEKTPGKMISNEKEFDALPVEQQKIEVKRFLNAEVLIETLGEFRDTRSIPVLRPFLDNNALSYQASTALSKTGDPAILDELMQRLENQRQIDLSGFGNSALNRVIQEIDNPSTTDKKRAQLIGHIKGSKDPQRKQVLKGLALSHQNEEVREQAGLAYVNSIIVGGREAGDQDFIIQWANRPTENIDDEVAKVWVFYAMDKTWTPRYAPIVISMLTNAKGNLIRCEAATQLAQQKVTEAVPYLEMTLTDQKLLADLDRNERLRLLSCMGSAIGQINGRMYSVEVYESDFPDWTTQLERIKRGEGDYLWHRYKIIGAKRP